MFNVKNGKMAIFTEYERAILKKFENGGYVESEEEKDVVDDLASMGLVLRGYDWEKKCGTAKLTDLCARHIDF